MTVNVVPWDFLLNFFLFEEVIYIVSKLSMEGYKIDISKARGTLRGFLFNFTSEFRGGNGGTGDFCGFGQCTIW